MERNGKGVGGDVGGGPRREREGRGDEEDGGVGVWVWALWVCGEVGSVFRAKQDFCGGELFFLLSLSFSYSGVVLRDEPGADVAQLLRHFDFQLVDPTNPWVSKNYGLFMQRNMWTRVTLRQ